MEGDDEDVKQGKPQPGGGGPVAFSVPVCQAGQEFAWLSFSLLQCSALAFPVKV